MRHSPPAASPIPRKPKAGFPPFPGTKVPRAQSTSVQQGVPTVGAQSPVRVIETSAQGWHDSGMRVNLITQPSGNSLASGGSIPLSLTIRPACGLPGDYQCGTDSTTLLRLLRKETDLPATVLQRFEGSLYAPVGARLMGVELSEQVLTDIGYFID